MDLSTHALRVLNFFFVDPSGKHYGLEIARETGLAGGTLYPILARLERNGLLASEWEAIDPAAEGRRPRRYYELTAHGAKVTSVALERTARQLNLELSPSLRLRMPEAGARA